MKIGFFYEKWSLFHFNDDLSIKHTYNRVTYCEIVETDSKASKNFIFEVVWPFGYIAEPIKLQFSKEKSFLIKTLKSNSVKNWSIPLDRAKAPLSNHSKGFLWE